MNFYTNICLRGKNVLHRGYDKGSRVQRQIPFSPCLYVPSNKPTKFKTIHGKFVEEMPFDTVYEANKFIEMYKGVNNYEIYGNTTYIYQYLYNEFPAEVHYDFDLLKIVTIDIETTCESGFPSITSPNEKVIAITISTNKGQTYVLGLGEFTVPGVHAIPYTDETELLEAFVAIWKKEDPDIVTGWNIRFFDIPYLVARMNRLEDGWGSALSPWGKVREKVVNRMGRDHTVYSIDGIATMDYMEMYQKFTYVTQESYALNHICSVELGEEKLSYGKYETLLEFYTNDFQRFMEYNVRDVVLVQKLEEKLKLTELCVAMAYSAHINFEDVFSQVRAWDAIIHHHLMSRGIVVPQKTHNSKEEMFAGAYVKEPIVGIHDWVVSYDLASLYPHLIQQYNISPETQSANKLFHRGAITPEQVLNLSADAMAYAGLAKQHEVCVAGNGVAFSKTQQGFLPKLMETMYEERKKFKRLMLEAKKKLEEIDDELKKRSII